jgi:4-hydroxybenzoate polyprenyltransferase
VVGRSGKPIPAGLVSRHTVGVAVWVAGLATVVLGLLSGIAADSVITLGLIGGLLYNWPMKATVASVLPYLVSFGALAGFVVLGLPGSPIPPWWVVAAGALLGGGAHFANVLPDLTDDTRTGVNGLPHRFGYVGSWVAASALLLSASMVLTIGPRGPASWLGVAVFACAVGVLVVGWFASRRPGSRAAFQAALIVAFADVVLLVVSGTSI